VSVLNMHISNAICDFLELGGPRDRLLVFTDDTGQYAEVREMAQDLKVLCSLVFRAANYLEVVSRYQSWIMELSAELGFPVAELHFCELTNPRTPEWRNVAWERRLRILHDASSMFADVYEPPSLVTYHCGSDWEAVSRTLPPDFWIGVQVGVRRRRTRTLQVVHSRLLQQFLESDFSNLQGMLIQDAGDAQTHTKLVFPSAGARLTGNDRATIEAMPERLRFKSLI
jgi:hypothetical protein